MAVFLVAMATASLIYFLMLFLRALRNEFGLYIFLVLLPTVYVHYVWFSQKLGEKL